jgi:ribosomal protein S18 acetylase RimI-like enzyme
VDLLSLLDSFMAGNVTMSLTALPLGTGELVAIAQCIVIDADAFPYASTQFGSRPASAEVWVARVAGEARVLGFVAARARRKALDIEGLAVAYDSRRRGIGRALLRAVIDRARAGAFETVSLHVWAGNDGAIQMYRTEGFGIRRALVGYYRAGTFDAKGDAFEMVLHLGL